MSHKEKAASARYVWFVCAGAYDAFNLPVCSFTIPHAGSVSHPHPSLINQEVIAGVQLFIEHTSYESHPFFNRFQS